MRDFTATVEDSGASFAPAVEKHDEQARILEIDTAFPAPCRDRDWPESCRRQAPDGVDRAEIRVAR